MLFSAATAESVFQWAIKTQANTTASHLTGGESGRLKMFLPSGGVENQNQSSERMNIGLTFTKWSLKMTSMLKSSCSISNCWLRRSSYSCNRWLYVSVVFIARQHSWFLDFIRYPAKVDVKNTSSSREGCHQYLWFCAKSNLADIYCKCRGGVDAIEGQSLKMSHSIICFSP